VGPKRDLLGEFTHAMRAEGFRSGFYYSLGEFNHPLYPKPQDKKPDGNLGRVEVRIDILNPDSGRVMGITGESLPSAM
jgi:alpha-L-fucosidase